MHSECAAPRLAITAKVNLQFIRETKAHVTVYTDRFATDRTTTWGTTMVTTIGDPVNPVVVLTSKIREAVLTSSYEEENAALLLAPDWARAHCPTGRIANCSDSKCLHKAIEGNRFSIEKTPSHVSIPPNQNGTMAKDAC